MPCHFVDLSPELQLKITDELRHDINADEIQDDKEPDPYDSNAEKPDEKKERKERQSRGNRVHDLLNWSCTSRFFRNLLAPYIFESISLFNTDRSGSSIYALSRSEQNRHVKELIYVGRAPGDAHRDEKEYSDTEAILPRSVDSVLSNLGSFPNLENISVEFPYKFADYSEWDEGLDLCAEEEPDEAVVSEESKVAWRALMAKSWDALMQNKGKKYKCLQVRKLGPIKVSNFNHVDFHKFLGRFERFELSIYGEDNGAGWSINKVELYTVLMGKLGIYFFDHLTSVTELTIKAPEEGPLGLQGTSHAPLELRKGQMPALRTLFLEYILIGQELIDFLIDHVNTLESLSMLRCSADVNGLAEDGIPWSHFFNALINAEFERLCHFDLLSDKIPLTRAEKYGEEEDEVEVSEQVKNVRQVLKDDENRRLFPYTTLCDKYGAIYQDDKQNLDAFERGEDQASYDRLIVIINKNMKRDGGN